MLLFWAWTMKVKTKRQIVEEESQGGICSNILLVAPV